MLPQFDNSNQFQVAAREAVLRTELKDLNDKLEEYKKYRDYYNGDQELVYTTELFKSVFGSAFEGFRDNWMRPIVEPVLDKLQLTGIGMNRVDEPDERKTAKLVWDVFRMNEIEEEQFNLHEGTLVESHAYMILWPDSEIGVRMDWQPASLVRIKYNPDIRRKADWAVKRWKDDDGTIYVSVYTDKNLYKFTQQEGQPTESQVSSSNAFSEVPELATFGGLKVRSVKDEPWPLPHKFGAVPVVEFVNPGWRSDLKDAIPQQNALNKVLLDMLIASEFAAVPQKIIETMAAQPKDGWKSGAGEVWHLPIAFDPDGKAITGQWGVFEAMDPGNFIRVIEMWRQHMALTSRTPLRYFASVDRGGRGDAPSGDSLLVDDQPHNNKVARKQLALGNRHMEVARLIARVLPSADVKDLRLGEALWRDPRFEFRAAVLEEAKLMVDVGLPFKWIIRNLGLTPEEISRLEEWKDEEVDEAKKQQEEQMAAAEAARDQGNNTDSSSSDSSSSNSSDNPR